MIKLPHNAGKQQVAPRAYMSKSCELHRNYGYTMEDCTIPRDQIQCLVRQGLLDKHIARRRRSRSRDRDARKRRWRSCSRRKRTLETSNEEEEPKNRQPQEIWGVIDYIAGGFTRGGETSSVRKRHLRAIIAMEFTFPWPPNTLNLVISFYDLDF